MHVTRKQWLIYQNHLKESFGPFKNYLRFQKLFKNLLLAKKYIDIINESISLFKYNHFSSLPVFSFVILSHQARVFYPIPRVKATWQYHYYPRVHLSYEWKASLCPHVKRRCVQLQGGCSTAIYRMGKKCFSINYLRRP